MQSLHESEYVAIHQKRDGSLTANKATVKKNYYKMFFMLLQWSYSQKLSETKCNKVLERFFIELFEDRSFANWWNKLWYLARVLMIDPMYFIKNKTFRRFTGRMIGYL